MKIGLFIPCYINACYPQVGVASFKLLRSLGLDVDYPMPQTCCGQPQANGGFEHDSKPLAEHMQRLFEKYDYVVGPSASCVVFVKDKYPHLLHRPEHECISSHIFEICEFLHDIIGVDKLSAEFPHKVSVHNSCHGMRLLHLSSPSELMIPHYNKLIDLLKLVKGIEIFTPQRRDECCGFGGLFSIEEPDVSISMGTDKVLSHMATGAEFITGADSSCLMHMQGIIDRRKFRIRTKHIVEILAAGL